MIIIGSNPLSLSGFIAYVSCCFRAGILNLGFVVKRSKTVGEAILRYL